MKPNTINPFTLVQEDAGLPIILVTRKKENVLLPKTADLKSLIPTIYDAFNLEKDSKITYHITTCGLCPGEQVRVLPAVLENKSFWRILEHLVIEVSGDEQKAAEQPTARITHKHKTRRTTQVLSRKTAKPRSSIAIDPQDVEHSEPPPSQPIVTVKKERTNHTHTSSSRRHSVSAHQHKVKAEPAAAEASSQDKQPSRSQSQEEETTTNTPANSNERFNFLVVNEATGKEQHFRGRGSYSIQKVLDKVCDVLEVDSVIARLFYYVDIDDFDDGDSTSRQAIPLERHQTLAECGITENSILTIAEDPDYEEESEA